MFNSKFATKLNLKFSLLLQNAQLNHHTREPNENNIHGTWHCLRLLIITIITGRQSEAAIFLYRAAVRYNIIINLKTDALMVDQRRAAIVTANTMHLAMFNLPGIRDAEAGVFGKFTPLTLLELWVIFGLWKQHRLEIFYIFFFFYLSKFRSVKYIGVTKEKSQGG